MYASTKRTLSFVTAGFSLLIISFIGVIGSGSLAGMAGMFIHRPGLEEPALLHPIERIAYSDDWRFTTERTGRYGDMAFVILRTGTDPCHPLESNHTGLTIWQMVPQELTTPSSEGGKTGLFHEILVPRSAATCAMSRYILVEWPCKKHPSYSPLKKKIIINQILE